MTTKYFTGFFVYIQDVRGLPIQPAESHAGEFMAATYTPELCAQAAAIFQRLVCNQSPHFARIKLLQTSLASRAENHRPVHGGLSPIRESTLSFEWVVLWCGEDDHEFKCANSKSYLSYLRYFLDRPSHVYSMICHQDSPLTMVTLLASLERKAAYLENALWGTRMFSFTWLASWIGDAAESLTAFACTCSASALDPLRRILSHRLRPEQSNVYAPVSDILSAFRRNPLGMGNRSLAVRQLKEFCYGPRCDAARLRNELVRSRIECSRKRRKNACTARSGEFWKGSPNMLPDLSAEFCNIEMECLSKGLISTGIPAVFAPIMRLLSQIARLKTELRSAERSRVGRQYQQIKARMGEIRTRSCGVNTQVDGVVQPDYPVSKEMLIKYAADPTLCKHLSLARLPTLRLPAISAALQTDRARACSVGVALEIQYLMYLGAPAPRCHHLLLEGTQPGPQATAEIHEDISRISSDVVLRRRHQVLEFIRLANTRSQYSVGVCTKRDFASCRATISLVENILDGMKVAGVWSFGACLDELVPLVLHQPAHNSLDDDPRPRPLPLLSLDTSATESNRQWLISSFRTSYRGVFLRSSCMPPRLRRVLNQAYLADPSKVAKSWAPVCLHPLLEEPSEVPHSGPYDNDHTPLGHSRYFSWCPWQPTNSVAREDAAQMEAMIETMEPQEYWIQLMGLLKKDAIRAAHGLHQEHSTGHLSGQMKLSALCRHCGTEDQPVAALWCACKREYVPQIFREKWHLPVEYLATSAWRAGHESGGSAVRPLELLFVGPRWLPTAPDEPPYHELASLIEKAKKLSPSRKAFVACGGAWWNTDDYTHSNGFHPYTFDSLYLPSPEYVALVVVAPEQRPALLRRRPLDSRFVRCDAERMMFSLASSTPLYNSATRLNCVQQRAHESFHLEPLPLQTGSHNLSIITTSRYAFPMPDTKPKDEYDACVESMTFEFAPASLFQKRILSIDPRLILSESRLAVENVWVPKSRTLHATPLCAPSCVDRAGIRTVGQRVETKMCRSCRTWQSDEDRCDYCGRQLYDNPCRRCGELRHVAVTTTHGAEVWSCARCGNVEGMLADSGERHDVYHSDDGNQRLARTAAVATLPVPYTLKLTSIHPALSAAWSQLIESLLQTQGYWIRSSYDGQSVDTNIHPSHLKRLITKVSKMRTHFSGCDGEIVHIEHACPTTLRIWPVQHILHDWRAAATLLGMSHATSSGNLLQLLMASNMFAGQSPLTLQSAARMSGGVVRL